MTSPAAKVGAPSASSASSPSAAPSKGPSKLGKFDIVVYPTAQCKLVFEVIKNNVRNGMTWEEISRNWTKWTKASKPIDKMTTLHVTLPAGVTSYSIVFHTNNARNTSHHVF